MPKIITTDTFIARSREIHGDVYDYTSTEYNGSHRKLNITCRVHGVFRQRASDHTHNKAGCPKCAVTSNAERKKHDTTSFIARAQSVHGDKYDYSLVDYVSAHSKVRIICTEHGEFTQTPGSHLFGRGCAECKSLLLAKVNKYGIDDFVLKSRAHHGDKYDYSLVDYSKSSDKVKIICPNHGVFEQTAVSHMNGKGCMACYMNRVTTRVYVENAREVHGNKYDYSLVDYVCSKDKVKIICPNHGVFEQTAGEHVRGVGCAKCTSYGFDSKAEAHLYFLTSDDGRSVKIGITNNLERRINELRRATPFPFSLSNAVPMKGDDAALCEKVIHSMMISAHLRGFDGATEWFKMEEGVETWVK